jgi:hypothetical protein
MEMKKMLAGWSKICPGCNIGRKYPTINEFAISREEGELKSFPVQLPE